MNKKMRFYKLHFRAHETWSKMQISRTTWTQFPRPGTYLKNYSDNFQSISDRVIRTSNDPAVLLRPTQQKL